MIMAETVPSRPRRIPKSQLNVPEHVRKLSVLKAEAKEQLLVEQGNFSKQRLNELLDPFYDYAAQLGRVPEEYLSHKIKQRLEKAKELTIHRTIQTESAMKLINDWTMPNMMLKVKKEKVRKRAAELDRLRKEEEARDLRAAPSKGSQVAETGSGKAASQPESALLPGSPLPTAVHSE
jgi:hypothetical protein